jgi:hypothetical protein
MAKYTVDIKNSEGIVLAQCSGGKWFGNVAIAPEVIKEITEALSQGKFAEAFRKDKSLDCQGVLPDGRGKIDIK